MEPLEILLQYYDTEITVMLKSGDILNGKFVKYKRNINGEAEWQFLDKKDLTAFEKRSDMKVTRRIMNDEIASVKKISE